MNIVEVGLAAPLVALGSNLTARHPEAASWPDR